jgi:cytochrome c biogenesis protein CcmG/thiol:disulfide interchange protein DsbE
VKRLVYILPVLAFLALATVLFHSLMAPPPGELPSALVGKPVPPVTLSALDTQTQGFGPQDLARGKVTVVNVFASWCAPCRSEAPVLQTLAQMRGITLYGFVYKDKPNAARAFLKDVGNPFSRIGLDADGRAGIDWGVYGVPETYVVDGHGVVRERFVGELTPDLVSSRVLPAIEAARND